MISLRKRKFDFFEAGIASMIVLMVLHRTISLFLPPWFEPITNLISFGTGLALLWRSRERYEDQVEWKTQIFNYLSLVTLILVAATALVILFMLKIRITLPSILALAAAVSIGFLIHARISTRLQTHWRATGSIKSS